MHDNLNNEPRNYYHSLKHYTPLCYSGKGVPLLFLHDTYHRSLPCILIIDLIFTMVIVFLSITLSKGAQYYFKAVVLKLTVLIVVLINFSYFLTVFMNPGIVSEEHLQISEGEIPKFCQRCNRKTLNMEHCVQCEICVENLDHHCGFFGKCIGGGQRFAFYGFLMFMFCGFIVLLLGITVNMN